MNPDQIIRDREGILKAWHYLDVFQLVSPYLDGTLL